MVFKIVWTPIGLETYLQAMDYLEKEWSEKMVNDFAELVENRITVLSEQPYIGLRRSEKEESVRSIVLHKRVILVYKIRPIKKVIEISLFWNTYQNPKKLKIK